MSKQGAPPTVSAEPFVHWLKQRGQRGDKKAVADKVGVIPQVITNWQKRGIPPGQVSALAAAIGMTGDEYRRRAGDLPSLNLPATFELPVSREMTPDAKNRLGELSFVWGDLSVTVQQQIVSIAKAVATEQRELRGRRRAQHTPHPHRRRTDITRP